MRARETDEGIRHDNSLFQGSVYSALPAIELVSGPFGSRIVYRDTHASLGSVVEVLIHERVVTVTGFANYGAMKTVSQKSVPSTAIEDVDENGYSAEKVDRLLRLAGAPLDDDAPDGEEEFMNWLNSD